MADSSFFPGELSPDDHEGRKNVTVNTLKVDNTNPICLLINSSSWNKLLRAAAWIIKAKKILWYRSQKRKYESLHGQDKHCNETKTLSVKDIKEAEQALIVFEQRRHFIQELHLLKRGKCLSSKHCLYKLDLFIDKDVLRVGGQTNKSAIPEQSNHLAKTFTHVSSSSSSHSPNC